jgi:hypothetical protein
LFVGYWFVQKFHFTKVRLILKGFQIRDLICIHMNSFPKVLVSLPLLNTMGVELVGFDTQFFLSFCMY